MWPTHRPRQRTWVWREGRALASSSGPAEERQSRRRTGVAGRGLLLPGDVRVLAFAPLANVALRAPEFLAHDRYLPLIGQGVTAAIVALLLAAAFRVAAAILDS